MFQIRKTLNPKISLRQFTCFLSSVVNVEPKVKNGYLIDTRGPGQRELITDNLVIKNKRFRFEIADKIDHSMIVKFLADVTCKKIAIQVALGMKPADVYPVLDYVVSNALKYSISPMLFDGDKLVATYIVSVIDENTLPKYFPFDMKVRQTGKYEFQIKDDYGIDVDNGPFDNVKANMLSAYLGAFNEQCGNLLPLDCNSLIYGELVGVHDDYKGYGIMSHFCSFIEKLGVLRYNADYFGATTVSAAAFHVTEKLNRKLLVQIPYNKFRYHGSFPFASIDELPGACFNVKKLDKKMNNYLNL